MAPAVVLVVTLLAAVAAWSQFGSSMLDPGAASRISDRKQSPDAPYIASSPARQRSSSSEAGAPRDSAFHASVLHSEGRCHVRQSVRNLGKEPLENVSLNFALLDAAGKPVLQKVDATAAAAIPAGAVRKLDFHFPCPGSITGIDVRMPTLAGGDASPVAELVSAAPDINVRGLDPATSIVLAVEIPPLDICPFPERCELQVRIPGGGTALFRFRRAAEDSDVLISEDGILIGHLRGQRTAELDLDAAMAGAIIPLTGDNLVEVTQPGRLSRWFGRFFDDGEGN